MMEALQSTAAAAGIVLHSPPVIANSHRAFELAEFARTQGRFDAVHRALFRAYFEGGRNIGEIEVLTAIAGETGLDAEAARAALVSGRYREQVDQQVEDARELGLTSTPTFLFADRFALVGAQEYQLFERVLQRLGARRRVADRATDAVEQGVGDGLSSQSGG